MKEFSRRDFLKVAGVAGVGVALEGCARAVEEIFPTPQESHAKKTPFPLQDRRTATETPIPETPTAQPTELVKPVDGYAIDGDIHLDSAEPTRWLFDLPREKILTPRAYAYGFSEQNEADNVFYPGKPNIYSYSEKYGTPVVWAHSGRWGYITFEQLFMDPLVDYIRHPTGLKLATRQEGEIVLKDQLVGSSVYLMQVVNALEHLLPRNVGEFASTPAQVRLVQAEIVAAVLVPRWKNGKDFIVEWYDKSIMDIYEQIRREYPDDRRWDNLPGDDTLLVRTCVPHFYDDPKLPVYPKDNDPTTPEPVDFSLYGRLIFALKISRNP